MGAAGEEEGGEVPEALEGEGKEEGGPQGRLEETEGVVADGVRAGVARAESEGEVVDGGDHGGSLVEGDAKENGEARDGKAEAVETLPPRESLAGPGKVVSVRGLVEDDAGDVDGVVRDAQGGCREPGARADR